VESTRLRRHRARVAEDCVEGRRAHCFDVAATPPSRVWFAEGSNDEAYTMVWAECWARDDYWWYW